MDKLKVLPTFEAAFGTALNNTSNQTTHEDSDEVHEAEEVTEESSQGTVKRQKKTSHEQKRSISKAPVEAAAQASAGADGQETYVAEDINDLIRQASRATSLATTPAPGG